MQLHVCSLSGNSKAVSVGTEETYQKESNMNQKYHYVSKTIRKGDVQSTQITVRIPWDKSTGEKYHSSPVVNKAYGMFGEHEMRQFLEPLGSYSIATIDSEEEAVRIKNEGLMIEDPITHEITRWYAVGSGGYVRDNGMILVLLPKKVDNHTFREILGLRIELSNWKDGFKVGKYLKRLYSNHRVYLQGTVITHTPGDVVLVKLDNGHTIMVRYITLEGDDEKLVDGMNLVSTHLGRALPESVKNIMPFKLEHGTGLRVTALSPKGFSKGHAIVLDGLKFDLVFFNSKKLLYGDRFTFAMDELHPGNLFTDAQSVINFQLYNGPFMTKWAIKFMRNVIDAVRSEERLKEMLSFYNIEFHKDEDGEYFDKEKDWALLRALRADVSITTKPALLRKVWHLFVTKVMNCEYGDRESASRPRAVRIPIDSDDGGARYIMVDPMIFDEFGMPSQPGILRGNTVYCPKHVGQVVFHRQPNAHRNEHHVADSVQPKELANMDNGSFMWMSRDVISSVLLKLGGGDQDDRVVYHTDPDVVHHFKSLPPYPVVEVEKKQVVKSLKNRFSDVLKPPKYDLESLVMMFTQQAQQRVNIGQVVNPIMVDTLISDSMPMIIEQLSKLIRLNPHDTKRVAALDTMKKYDGYSLSPMASDLESIIDAVKRDGSDVTRYVKSIRDFWGWLAVIPESMIRRLPQSQKLNFDPVPVQTQLDLVLNDIQKARMELEDVITALSWELCEEVPLAVLTYPFRERGRSLALAIRTEYNHVRDVRMKNAITTEDRIKAFLDTDEIVTNMFKDNPLMVEAVAELYKATYERRLPTAPLDDAGRPRAFPDGLLWGPRFGKYVIEMLDRSGVGERFVKAHLDSRRYRRQDVDVDIRDGFIMPAGSKTLVGVTDPYADGVSRKMQHGLIGVPTMVVKPELQKQGEVEQYTVVAGHLVKRTTPKELQAWRAHANKKVWLIPYEFEGVEGMEHAVKVELEDGSEYGNLSRKDAGNVLYTVPAWLVPGSSPNTMTVVLRTGGR